MKSEEQLKIRLSAELKACATDPTLNENDFVQGYIEALRFVLQDDRK